MVNVFAGRLGGSQYFNLDRAGLDMGEIPDAASLIPQPQLLDLKPCVELYFGNRAF